MEKFNISYKALDNYQTSIQRTKIKYRKEEERGKYDI
jgi:hypothetical protein